MVIATRPYSKSNNCDNLFFISGKIALRPDNGEWLMSAIEDETKQALSNCQSILEEVCTSSSCVVKSTIHLVDLSNVDTINKSYGQYMEERYTDGSTVEMSKLLMNANIKIKCIAHKEIKT